MRRRDLLLLLPLILTGCGREEAVREGHTTGEWVATLEESPDPQMRRKAIAILADLGPDEASQTLRPLMKAVKDPDPEIRFLALDAIGKMGPKGKPAMTTVAGAMRDDNRQVYLKAMKVHHQMALDSVKDIVKKPEPAPNP